MEAIIALSILFLATELVKKQHGEVGLTQRYPWIVALSFGLLHGFGFAGALSEIGLPQADIPLALFSFNVGVEVGQLMFVAVVLVVDGRAPARQAAPGRPGRNSRPPTASAAWLRSGPSSVSRASEMLHPIDGLPDHVLGFRAEGRVTGEDYRDILEPALDDALTRHTQIDFLYHLGPDFTRFTTTALWDDARLGLHHLKDFRRVAVVTDVDWIAVAVGGADRLTRVELRCFDNAEINAARDWLSA